MGFMKSLFGNKGVQQEIPEYRIVITDVGPNPVQIISIIQKYLQSDYTELSNLINGNILDEQSTVCTLESLELLQQMQQELDEAGAFTYIQKNWQDEDDAEMNTSIAIFSLGDQGEKVIEAYHQILGLDRKDLELKLLNDLSENNGFQISARNERVEELIKVLDNLGADYEMDMNENDSDVDEDDMYVEMDTEAALIITSTGDKKVQLIKLIREYTGSDLREAKECIDEIEAGNGFFIKGSLEVLEEMKQELDAIGATSKMKYRDKQEQGGCYRNNCCAELASGTKFCPKCGAKVEEAQKMFCSQCGNEIMPGAKFCTKCGARCM